MNSACAITAAGFFTHFFLEQAMADKWKTEQSNLSPQYFAVVGEAGRFVTPFVLSQETATQIVADHNAVAELVAAGNAFIEQSSADFGKCLRFEPGKCLKCRLVSAIQSATAHTR